jgi:hypothetical protein
VVEWCLVVTTKEEAMICALARASATTKGTTDISSNGSRSNGTSSSSSSSSSSPWTVVLTKFIIPSDWISFLSVTSTKSGRVFLGGQDGNVYELDYDLLVKRHQQQQDLQQGKSVGECLDRFYDGSDDISSCRDGGAGSSSSSSTECPDV